MSEYNLGDVRFLIDHEQRILYAERHDNLSKEGVYAEWQAIQQLDGFDPAFDTIVDYTFVPCIDLDASDIIKINKDVAKYDPRTGNVAMVSGLKEGRYLLARFFCTIVNVIVSRKHQVFKTKAEAETWLCSMRGIK